MTAEWPLRAWAVPCGQTSGLSELRVTVALPPHHPPWPCCLVSGWTPGRGPKLCEQTSPCCCLECSRMSCVLVVELVSLGNTLKRLWQAQCSLWVCLEAAGMRLGVCPIHWAAAPLSAHSWWLPIPRSAPSLTACERACVPSCPGMVKLR